MVEKIKINYYSLIQIYEMNIRNTKHSSISYFFFSNHKNKWKIDILVLDIQTKEFAIDLCVSERHLSVDQGLDKC
jgi:hypothetical protein